MSKKDATEYTHSPKRITGEYVRKVLNENPTNDQKAGRALQFSGKALSPERRSQIIEALSVKLW